MTDNFPAFAKAVRKQFDILAHGPLFQVTVDRDTVWQTYMDAFPEGTNPIFRTRAQHDCSCCRAFIRSAGNVVAVKDGVLVTIWDIGDLPHPYNVVSAKMADFIRAQVVTDVFLTQYKKHGTEKNLELDEATGRTIIWNHFSVEVPNAYIRTHNLAEARGDARTNHAVLLRGVRELTPAAVTQVLELIAANSLYRGTEHVRAVKEFQKIQQRFKGINDPEKQDLMAWSLLVEAAAVTRFRNTVIGTLVQDLSNGVDLEEAVKAFEKKVAPQNYKRPTALITKGMVEAATKTIAELGLEEALERRHARFADVSVNSVLWVDGSVVGKMKDSGGLKGLLMQEVKSAPFDLKRAEQVSVGDFISKLPAFTNLQLYLEGRHSGNFASLTAPVHPEVKQLFKWGNDFAWSYDGNVTDSIKERVKRAGGRVENVALRVSLAWYNHDDLDLHCETPSGRHISYMSKAGTLDVDMNAGFSQSREPVENMRWVDLHLDGVYQFKVHQFSKRESIDVGFEIEVETAQGITSLRYEKAVASKTYVNALEVVVVNGVAVVKANPLMKVGYRSVEKWGVKTLELAKVNSLILSPNHWDEDAAVGNKHWFFILEGCKNPEPARGIYNEFLHGRLEKHRKVFEVLGDKTKCPVADEQLSGLGFSSTRQDTVTVLATGPGVNKVYTINFD